MNKEYSCAELEAILVQSLETAGQLFALQQIRRKCGLTAKTSGIARKLALETPTPGLAAEAIKLLLESSTDAALVKSIYNMYLLYQAYESEWYDECIACISDATVRARSHDPDATAMLNAIKIEALSHENEELLEYIALADRIF